MTSDSRGRRTGGRAGDAGREPEISYNEENTIKPLSAQADELTDFLLKQRDLAMGQAAGTRADLDEENTNEIIKPLEVQRDGLSNFLSGQADSARDQAPDVKPGLSGSFEKSAERPNAPYRGQTAKRTKRRPGERAVFTGIRMPGDLRLQLEAAAAARGVSLSKYVVDLCYQDVGGGEEPEEPDGPK